jgi:MoaA/NifB/PqqE/SkfB family radical SAM enzyme
VKIFRYLIQYYFETLLLKKKPILGGIKLSHDCNLSCLHCHFWKQKGSSLSFENAVGVLRAMYKLGVRIMIFEGGEPFLWRDGQYDIRSITDEAKKLFFNVGITTNGTLPIKIGTDIVWVSVDGLRETHNRIRGDCFDSVMANIESSSHPNIFAHVTINTLNYQEIPRLVEFLSPKVKGITIQFHYPFEKDEDELFLPFEKRESVLEDLIGLKKAGFPIAVSYTCLNRLKDNHWRCRPWMIASADPDGKISNGCYVKGRGNIACEKCGFAVHAEISLAYRGVFGSIKSGRRIFFNR